MHTRVAFVHFRCGHGYSFSCARNETTSLDTACHATRHSHHSCTPKKSKKSKKSKKLRVWCPATQTSASVSAHLAQPTWPTILLPRSAKRQYPRSLRLVGIRPRTYPARLRCTSCPRHQQPLSPCYSAGLRSTWRTLKLILMRSPSAPLLFDIFGSTSCVNHAGNRIKRPSTGSK